MAEGGAVEKSSPLIVISARQQPNNNNEMEIKAQFLMLLFGNTICAVVKPYTDLLFAVISIWMLHLLLAQPEHE